MAYNFIVTKKEFNLILQTRKQLLPNYEVQEADCQLCKQLHPSNVIMEDVLAKVSILNAYYSTRLDSEKMAKHLTALASTGQLDARLSAGDPSLVLDIATNSAREEFSFATKYCALLSPGKYPIYDKYVWLFFSKLRQLGFFARLTNKKFANVNKNGCKAYADYVEIYNEFIDKSGIRPFAKNYREVDAYIWGATKMYLLLEKTSKYTNMRPWATWLQATSASLVANLTATAIWKILSLINF